MAQPTTASFASVKGPSVMVIWPPRLAMYFLRGSIAPVETSVPLVYPSVMNAPICSITSGVGGLPFAGSLESEARKYSTVMLLLVFSATQRIACVAAREPDESQRGAGLRPSLANSVSRGAAGVHLRVERRD